MLILQAENHSLMGYGQEARLLLERAADTYGKFPGLEERLAEARALEREGGPEETVADILARPRASAEQMEPFLGAWRIVSPGSPPNLVTFSIDEGRVVGTTQLAAPDGSLGLTLENAVIEVGEDGKLGFGYVNNMRPRGIIYYSVELTASGRLTGSMGFLGVRVPPDMEEYLARQRFEFQRVGSQ